MNHIFRLVLNRTLGIIQVASEITRGQGKGSTRKRRTAPGLQKELRLRVLCTAVVLALGSLAVPALAQVSDGGNATGSVGGAGTGVGADVNVGGTGGAAGVNGSSGLGAPGSGGSGGMGGTAGTGGGGGAGGLATTNGFGGGGGGGGGGFYLGGGGGRGGGGAPAPRVGAAANVKGAGPTRPPGPSGGALAAAARGASPPVAAVGAVVLAARGLPEPASASTTCQAEALLAAPVALDAMAIMAPMAPQVLLGSPVSLVLPAAWA